MSDIHPTPEGWRRDKQPGHSRRASWMNYRDPSILLLTLVATDHRPVFGSLRGEQVTLNPLGCKVAEEITQIPTYIGASAIEIRSYIVMPDHVHILLQIHERLPKHIGQFISWFKLRCNDHYKELSSAQGSRGAVESRDHPAVSRSVLGGTPPSQSQALFAPEYHDRILSHEGQLANMTHYIHDNPRRRYLKRANPDLFKIHQQYTITDVPCTVLGNMFLAEHPMRAMVQCSRSLSQEDIDAYRDSCLNAAERGVIHVSAAISEGEKQICRALREAGHPLIILLTEGFPKPDSPHYKYYKPSGVYFEACAAGRLLLVEPNAEYYDRTEVETKVYAKTGIRDLKHDAKRYRFLALNALAEKIAQV